jgi:hypothetical protein
MSYQLSTLSLLLALPPPPPVQQADPTSAYERRTVEGFTVLVNRRLLEHPQAAEDAMEEVALQLRRIARSVPPAPLAELREVRLWMEWANRPDRAAEFHPSEAWLRENHYNPEKAGGVEIANAGNFVKWSREDQPWALFHELAHSYHFRVLGARNRAVMDAYRRAKRARLYESVGYVHGGNRKAYALENDKEYFAEISEAYFGRNDFFPFTREDLERYDPTGFQLMTQVWGQPVDRAN